MHLIKDFILTVLVTLYICSLVKSNEKVNKDVANDEKVTMDVTNEEVIEDITTIEVTKDVTNEEVMKEYYCPEELHILNGSDSGNGYFRLTFEGNCTVYTYQVNCVNKSSIIKIKSIFTDHSNLASANLTSKIQVLLKENTTFSDGTKSLIGVNKWTIDSKNKTSTKDQIFFSQTSNITIIVTVNGIWPDIDLNFLYEEVEFEEYRKSFSVREGNVSPWVLMEERGYRPNSAYVFQITKPVDLRANSIYLGINKLHIDEGIGEYLLIGAGKDVFQGPPPLYISSLLSKKEIKINDENAYIVFIAASTRSFYSGFEITWKYNGTSITGKEDVTVDPIIDDESNSMPICIFNISAALNELNKSEDSFWKFRERLASLGNEYAQKNGKNLKIDSSQVRIIRVSAVMDKDDSLYVMVKIQHTEDGEASFDWKQLGHILSEYSSRYHSEVENGYWIKKCPQETRRKDQTHIIFYAILPVLFCLLFVLIWNWNQTPFSRIFSNKIKMALTRSRGPQMVPQEDNDFISNYVSTTIPKVRIINDQGRRYTWENDDDVLSSGTEQEADTVFNRADLRRSNSNRSDPREPQSMRSSTRSQKRPEINAAFEEEEEYKDAHDTPGTSTPATNTLNSQKSLLSNNSTCVTDETKL